MTKIKIGIGSCLMGNPVRYNGEHKRANQYIQNLKGFVELVPFCPEVGIGMGVPRETVRLVKEGDLIRLTDSNTQTENYHGQMREYALKQSTKLSQLSGYIFVKGSPSCGMERVTRFNEKAQSIDKKGVGIFADALAKMYPMMPVEEDGRLNDPVLRERFITRVYVWHAWREMMKEPIKPKDLIDFWSRHKYLVMSRHYPSYKILGRLLSDLSPSQDLSEIADEFIAVMMSALERNPSRKGHTNVLQHIKGYLKRDLSSEESRDIDEKIEQYRTSIVPLVVPMSLLKHQFKRHPNPYITDQVFMEPYPDEFGLRNQI